MQRKFLPALGIIIVTVILVAINEFTEMTFIKDFELIFIVAGMLFGFMLSHKSNKKNEN